MKNWKFRLKTLVTDLMPYAFSSDGSRASYNSEELGSAIGYVEEFVFMSMKQAYMAGHARAGKDIAETHGLDFDPSLDRSFADKKALEWINDEVAEEDLPKS